MEHISKSLPHVPKNLKPALGVSSEPEYDCSVCQDVGFVHPPFDGSSGEFTGAKPDYSQIILCQCRAAKWEREKQEGFLRYCHLPAHSEHWTFENFDTYGESDLVEALELSKRLAEGDENILWLTLLSESDRGKTHLAVAICRRWLALGKVARFAVVPEMLNELQDSFDLEGEASFRMKLKLLCNVSLLILDDLGTGKYKDWRREQVFTIINHRALEGLPLVVTSNCEIDNLFGSESEGARLDNIRIASRLQRESWCHIAVIGGIEHRFRPKKVKE